MKTPLYLHEEFMLLALRQDAGTVATSESIEFPLAAAIVSELMLQKRIELEQEKKDKQEVRLVDSSSLGDPILDEAMQKIAEAKRPARLQTWVERLAQMKDLKHRTAIQLCRRGILRADEDKILRIFTRKTYPEINSGPEQQLVERLRQAIFSDSEEIDARDSILISLANQTHLLRNKFDKQDLKCRKDRIEEIAAGSHTAKAAREAVDAMNTVLLVAVMMPILFD